MSTVQLHGRPPQVSSRLHQFTDVNTVGFMFSHTLMHAAVTVTHTLALTVPSNSHMCHTANNSALCDALLQFYHFAITCAYFSSSVCLLKLVTYDL